MAINTTLEALSDQAFGAAAAAYTVGLVCAAIVHRSEKFRAQPCVRRLFQYVTKRPHLRF